MLTKFSLRDLSRSEMLLSLLLVVILFLAYAPLVRATYGFGDDFVLMLADVDPNVYLREGRFGYALGDYLIHRNIHHVHQLGYIRLCSVAVIGTIAVIFFHQFRNWGGSRPEHFAAAIAMGTLPCLHTYACQSCLMLGICASIPVLVAAIKTFNATDQSKCDKCGFTAKYLPPFILMLLAATTYQPTLSFYWSIVTIHILDRRFLTSVDYRRRIIKTTVMGIIYLVICFLALKLYISLFDWKTELRSKLTSEPLDKLYWFLRVQLPQALNAWHLFAHSQRFLTLAIASLSLLVIAFGYFISCSRYLHGKAGKSKRGKSIIFQQVALLALIVLLSHAHWLVIDISPQSYRIIAPLGTVVFVLLYWSYRQITCLVVNARRRLFWRRAVLACATIATFFTCQHYSEKYWILPHSTGYGYLLMTLRTELTADTERIHIIRQGQQDNFVSEFFIECFGRPTTEREWMITKLVEAALRDAGVPHAIRGISHGARDEVPPTDPKTLVIDMRRLGLFRVDR
jgi:hypothetical protein